MKKFFLATLTSFFIIGSLLASAGVVFADDFGLGKAQQATGGAIPTTIGGQEYVAGLAGYIINIALGFLGVVFFIVILYAGGRWMLAMGKSEETTKAKDMMEAAIIGLIIVVSAYAIANFVFSSLASSGGGNVPAPTATTSP